MMVPRSLLAVLAASFFVAAASDIELTGTVVDQDGSPVQNAVVRLETAGHATATNVQGNFAITELTPVIPRARNTLPDQPRISARNNILHVAMGTKPASVRLDYFNAGGRRVASFTTPELSSGVFAIDPAGTAPTSLGASALLVRARVGKAQAVTRIMTTGGAKGAPRITKLSEESGYIPTGVSKASALDQLTVSKFGYTPVSVEITSYTAELDTITITKVVTLEPSTLGDIEDSLFKVLIERVQDLDTVGSYDEFAAADFISLRNGFEGILEVDSLREKSNVGLMVSALLSLNTSAAVKKLADSLDAYFTAVDQQSSEPVEPQPVMKRAVAAEGVTGLGKALAARTADLALAQVSDPSWPTFVTHSYIQAIAEYEVLPVLDKMIEAAARLESRSDANVMIEVEGEDTAEVDLGEIYAVDAYLHLARAYLRFFCIYDMDIYEPQTQNYSWIDTLYNAEYIGHTIYRLSGDTLQELWFSDDTEPMIHMARVAKYNLEREGFMTIREGKGYHSLVKQDLLAVPARIKSGLTYIRAETDAQDRDIIKISDLGNADVDLSDVRTQMIEDGVSAELADNFRSPEAIADFVTELLSGPYTFNETVDSVTINITVDLSAWFDNPVNDLRTLLPTFTWSAESEWVVEETEEWGGSISTVANSSFRVWDEDDVVDIDQSLIDSVVTDEWGAREVFLNTTYTHTAQIDSMLYIVPIRLTDDAGEVIPFEDIDSLIQAETFFPYFDDYTVNGLFPGMTRQKWLDLVYQ